MHDHTNGHNRARKRLLNLQEQHNNLQRQLQKLKATHTALLLENTIMESLCESLLVLQLSENSIGTQQQQQQQQQPHAAEQKQQQQQAGQQEQEEQLVQLLTTEGQLLQQLDELQLMPAADVSLLKAASTDGAQLPTIAPAPDQMAFFKEVLARLPVPGAHKITSMELTMLYKMSIEKGSLWLHLMTAGLRPAEACLAELRAILVNISARAASCMFVGRQDVISEYVARNAETLELFDPDNPPDFRQMIRGAVESIHLTPEQEEVIARYAPVWGRVMVPVDREFADLQQQISSAEVRLSTPCSSGSSNDSSSSSANASQQHPADSGSKTTSTHQLHDGPARAAQLEAQLQLLQRLKIVMHKKRMLTVGCSAWFLGRLSVPQAVRLAVLTWPYPVVYAMAAMVIQERWESQQQPSTRAPQPQAAA